MKIKDIIRNLYNEHPDPRLYECSHLASKYERFAKDKNVSFAQIFTTSFFPKLVSNHKQSEEYLLWDNHFWDLFEHFLLAIMKIEKDEMQDYIAYDLFVSIYMIFLSARFYKNSALSLVFAKRYAATGFFVPPYHIENNVLLNLELWGGSDALLYCKDFVFFHEMHHAQYKQNECQKSSDFNRVREICRSLHDSSIPEETKRIINELLSLSDTSILEELCCDVNSICCIAYIYSGGNHYDKEIAQQVINSVRFITLFISTLKRIDLVYRNWCITDEATLTEILSSSDNYIEIEARNFIVYFVALHQMGISKIDTNSDLFVRDECFYKYARPYYAILESDFISNIFLESKLYAQQFSKEECKVARDIIIGWHSGRLEQKSDHTNT